MAKLSVVKDPALFANDLDRQSDDQLLALALDLGSTTGYALAYFDPAQPISTDTLVVYMGQLDLSVGPYDSRGISACRLRAFLRKASPDLLFMENVKYTPPNSPNRITAAAIMARTYSAAEFLGGLKLAVTEFAEATGTPLQAIPIGSIKKRATGKGNANKQQVIRACNETFSTDLPVEDYEQCGADNIADAAFCLLVGLEELGAGAVARK